jgi:hypothetical protein
VLLVASPPCIVPRLVRRKIGRSTTRKSVSFSTWEMGPCKCDIHTSRQIESKEKCEDKERNLDEDDKRFFKLFTESTFEGSQAAALEMKKYAKR